MSQNDLTIANQGFASFRSDLNSALQALGSTNSGSSAPSTTFANQLFYDTTNNILKIRNEDNDAFISLFTLDQTNDNIESLTVNGVLTADSLSVDNFTLNGTELDLSSGDFTLDVAGDIILDADGGDFIFKDGGSGDEANKVIRFSTPSHDTDEENIQILQVESENTFNQISIGGGTSALNASTKLRFLTSTVDTTTGVERLSIDSSGNVVFNETGADADFRVESNGNANMLFVDGGNDHVNIGSSSDAGGVLNVSDGTSFSTGITVENTGDTHGSVIDFLNNSASPADNDYIGGLIFKETNSAGGTHQFAKIFGIATDITDGTEDGEITFETSAGGSSTQERCRISSTGVLMVGQTAFNPANVGTSLTSSGQLNGTASGDISLQLNRTSSNGNIAEFRYNNSAVGRIGSGTGRFSINGTNGSTGSGIQFDINQWLPQTHDGTLVDNTINLGIANYRMGIIYAGTGSINTSDRNEKQDIEELTDAEKRVAVVAKGLLRKYRLKDAVAEKGDKARTHFGIIAQDLEDAFKAESLDASNYGMFCSDTWWEKEITVDAVEAKDAVYEEVTDSDGIKTNNLVSHEVKAQDAYTYIDIKQEATEGYAEKTRLGVRYSELLAFIISAI